MISIEVQVSGSTLGRELGDDVEELGEFLDEISNWSIMKSEAEYLQDRFSSDGGKVAGWLRDLADAIEPPAK